MATESKAEVKPVAKKYLLVTKDFSVQKGAQCLRFKKGSMVHDQAMVVFLEQYLSNAAAPFKSITETEFKLRAAS